MLPLVDMNDGRLIEKYDFTVRHTHNIPTGASVDTNPHRMAIKSTQTDRTKSKSVGEQITQSTACVNPNKSREL